MAYCNINPRRKAVAFGDKYLQHNETHSEEQGNKMYLSVPMAKRQLATRYGSCVNSCANLAGTEFACFIRRFLEPAQDGNISLISRLADMLLRNNTFYSVKSFD